MGGEPAAERMTDFLRPAQLTLYTQETALTLQKKWTLIPDKDGPLALYRKFWMDANSDPQKLAPPVLVYADLMMTGDPRCVSAANLVYEKYLAYEPAQRT